MSVSGWPIWSLLKTVFGSILEVFLLCVAGYVLARRGILDKKTQKQVNRLNVSLFTPSLLFSKVAFFLTPEKLRELWIIPIVFVVTTACSMIVSYTFGSLLRLKRSQRSFAMAASMFMNSNSLPIALMQSLVYSVKELRWGDDDEKNAMLGRALTYLVLYSTLGMVLRWSYGVHLLSRADEEVKPESAPEAPPAEPEPTETTPLISSASTDSVRYASEHSTNPPALVLTQSDESSSSLASPTTIANQPCTPGRLCPDPAHGEQHAQALPQGQEETPRNQYFFSFPNTPSYSRSEASSSDDGESQDLPGGPPRTRRHRIWRPIRAFLHKVNAFMTVPMWAALASLIVACITPLQHTLEIHISPVKDALTAAGNCSIPLTLVVLGAYFHVPKPEEERGSTAEESLTRGLKTRKSDQSLVQGVRKIFDLRKNRDSMPGKSRAGVGGGDTGNTRPGETRTVAVAVLSRMILTPVILLPLLAILIATDAHQIFDDPVFVLSNVLLITSAPALTLAQITQAASGDAFERLISRTIFWAYCIVTPISTIVSVVVGLLLSKL